MKNLSILGSTGSIGRQTLELLGKIPNTFQVRALSCYSNLPLFLEQIKMFSPSLVSVGTPELAKELREMLGDLYPIDILYGTEGNNACASFSDVDIVVAAMVGMNGISPVISAISAGKDIALANKEVLVAGGSIVMPLSKEKGVRILPVDSEHSAIWQCIWDKEPEDIKELLLTASGGAFRGWTKEQMKTATREDALRHPTWSMGSKITIDSASMMNKGLEIIEASWLFSMPPERISVVIHPQSIIHSMVRMKDGAVLAQMGEPDMMLPIEVALFYPERGPAVCKQMDFFRNGFPELSFSACDTEAFPAVRLAYEAAKRGGSLATVMNSANEEAVAAFLSGKIAFGQLIPLVETCMEEHEARGMVASLCLEDIFALDDWARGFVRSRI